MICANHVYRYINMVSLVPMQALPTMKEGELGTFATHVMSRVEMT